MQCWYPNHVFCHTFEWFSSTLSLTLQLRYMVIQRTGKKARPSGSCGDSGFWWCREVVISFISRCEMSLSLWVKWKPLQEAKRRALALETVDQVQMGNGVLSVGKSYVNSHLTQKMVSAWESTQVLPRSNLGIPKSFTKTHSVSSYSEISSCQMTTLQNSDELGTTLNKKNFDISMVYPKPKPSFRDAPWDWNIYLHLKVYLAWVLRYSLAMDWMPFLIRNLYVQYTCVYTVYIYIFI